MWERVQEIGGERKKAAMADAFRLNCIEFGDADMKATCLVSTLTLLILRQPLLRVVWMLFLEMYLNTW